MKKYAVVIAGLTLGAFLANSNIIVSDNFDYADGSLISSPNWNNHSGTSGDLLVSGGQAVVQHGTPSEDANIGFASVAGNIYYGIDFTVPSIGSPTFGTDNEYFAHFKDSGFGFAGRLDIVGPSGAGDYSVGIASDESTADAIWATDLTFDVTYRAVVEYNQTSNIATLWINASTITDTSIVGEDRADPGDTIVSFALRQSDSDNNESILVDGLVIGTTFDDVVTAVPEPSTIAFILGALAFGFVAWRRRK